MAPLRILILAVLIYIGYRLLRKSFSKGKNTEEDKSREPGPSDRLTDILVEDPVCNSLVPKEQAVQLEQNGKIQYFCSQECCDKYTSEKGDSE